VEEWTEGAVRCRILHLRQYRNKNDSRTGRPTSSGKGDTNGTVRDMASEDKATSEGIIRQAYVSGGYRVQLAPAMAWTAPRILSSLSTSRSRDAATGKVRVEHRSQSA
jgi:hypothetical protein